MQARSVWAAELKRTIQIRGLSAAGVLRVASANSLPDKRARKMATVLETLRDGVVNYPFIDNDALMRFAERYPDLTARLFIEIRQISSLPDG